MGRESSLAPSRQTSDQKSDPSASANRTNVRTVTFTLPPSMR